MKKLGVALLTLLITMCVSTSAFAQSFTPSISYKNDVAVIGGQTTADGYSSYIEYISEDDDCAVDVVITPYINKDHIKDTFTGVKNEESIAELEEAYESITGQNEVTDFAPALIGKGLPFDIEDTCMVVSNVFDVSTYHDGPHDDSVDHRRVYNLKIGADSLEYFMYLLHYNAQEKTWEIVHDAHVSGKNRDTLTFSFDCCSPFAIITCGAKGNCQYDYACAINAGGDDYKFPVTGVNSKNNSNNCNCLLHFGGHCYCYIILVLLIISLIFNVYYILKRKEDDRLEELEEKVNRLENLRDNAIDNNEKE